MSSSFLEVTPCGASFLAFLKHFGQKKIRVIR
jgi:hypothetical protein